MTRMVLADVLRKLNITRLDGPDIGPKYKAATVAKYPKFESICVPRNRRRDDQVLVKGGRWESHRRIAGDRL